MKDEQFPTPIPYSSALPEDSALHVPVRAPAALDLATVSERARAKRLETSAFWFALSGLILTFTLCAGIGLFMGPIALMQVRRADHIRINTDGSPRPQLITRFAAWTSFLVPAIGIVLIGVALCCG